MDGSDALTELLPNRWDEAHAATLSPEALLLYRSNLLGSDKRVTNYGGGNTSSKLPMVDPLTGETVPVLWVKGSGGDIGSMKLDGFSTLYMDKLLAAQSLYRGPEHEDDMVALYPHLTFNLNPRATSIDTPLHGLIKHPHVDHVHPDAIIAIAAAADSEALTREIFAGSIGWVPWRRPGFELGVWLKRFVDANPEARGVVLTACSPGDRPRRSATTPPSAPSTAPPSGSPSGHAASPPSAARSWSRSRRSGAAPSPPA